MKFLKRREVPVYNVPKVTKAVSHPTAAAGASYLIDAGYPPLVAYAMSGSAEDVKKAIASGEDVNAPYEAYGLTPLMAATNRGNVAMVKLLLDSGADVRARSVYGKTAYNNLSKLKDKTARDKIKRLFDIAAKKQQ
ncbi:MAG: ankyrin repeat domain-containing protein [Thermodesulfobacteriota bacterium]|nr:ankyrin repeat domain-containing protein [Thermodesulfobacteriota bacterium]